MPDQEKSNDQLPTELAGLCQESAALKNPQAAKKSSLALGKAGRDWYALLFNNVCEAAFVGTWPEGTNLPGKFVEVNDMVCQRLGYTRAELLEMSPAEIDAPERPIDMSAIVGRLLRDGQSVFEGVHVAKDGRLIPVEVHQKLLSLGGERLILSTARDIGDRKRQEDELRRSEAKFHDLFENANDGILLLDKDDNFLEVNKKMAEMLGCTREELLQMNIFDLIPAEQRPHYIGRMSELKDAGRTDEGRSKAITKDGRLLDVEVSSSAILVEGKYAGRRTIVKDITDRKRKEAELRASEERYRELVEGLPDIVYSSGMGNLVYCSPRIEAILGIPLKDFYADQTFWRSLIHPEDRAKVEEALADFTAGRHFEIDYRIKDKEGKWHWFRDRSIGIRKEKGELVVTGLVTDITERKRLEEEIRELSMRDQLTGLYNRRGFMTLAEQQLKAAKRGKLRMRLAFIDADELKRINDAFGHEEGDRALAAVAVILWKTFRESDIVARIGGDEFAVLAIDAADKEQSTLSLRLQRNIDDFNARRFLQYKLGLSWGAVAYDPDAPQSLDQLMSAADALMYAQKKAKANR